MGCQRALTPGNRRQNEDSGGSRWLREVFPTPHWTQEFLSHQHRHLCDEVRRSQDALPQLKRQPGQFIERPSDAYRSLNRVGPTEAERS